MRHRFRSRATALGLAALFLGGAGGASDLDALLFHGRGSAVVANVPHVEATGNPNCHAERCALALRLANGRTAPALSVLERVEGIARHAAAVPPASVPHCFDPGLHLQSRAPPASQV